MKVKDTLLVKKKVNDINLHLSKDPCKIIYAETINVLHVLYRCKKNILLENILRRKVFQLIHRLTRKIKENKNKSLVNLKV